MTEVKENLNVNFQGFLALVEQRNEKVCSIAPINGIEFTDIITDESVRFSEPTVQDLQNIEMIKHNKRDPIYFDYFYDFKSPVVVVEFDFDWIPTQMTIQSPKTMKDYIKLLCTSLAQS